MISVGIDVSKGKSTVCMLKPEGELVKGPYEILHTMEDLDRLAVQLSQYPEECRVVMESTGHYHWPLLYTLVERGIFTSVINPYIMNRFCNQSIRKCKTDKIDSIKIAQYGIAYWSDLRRCTGRTDVYAELNLASRQYYHYTTLLVDTKVGLNNLLDQTMPGIKDVLQHEKLLAFVQKYTHFAKITSVSEESFSATYCKWAQEKGYRNNKSKAVQLYALAKNAIPVLPNTDFTRSIVLEAVRILTEIESTRNVILARMTELASTLPEYGILVSMPGIGPVLASRVIAEIGDVRRFHSRGALIAYAGIDAPPRQSGAFKATNCRISKRGNKYLRKVGYEIMMSLVMHNSEGNPVFSYIQKKRAEGKHTYCAFFAGLNKFLRIYYGKVNELYRNLQLIDIPILLPATSE